MFNEDIIIKPVLTEKSYDMMADKRYVFQVAPKATKTQIKTAVEEIFGDLPDLRAIYGKEANNFPTGAIGTFSYLNKIGFGLKHFAALNRKFDVNVLSHHDLIPLTRDVKDLMQDKWFIR